MNEDPKHAQPNVQDPVQTAAEPPPSEQDAADAEGPERSQQEQDRIKDTTEKLWDSTKTALNAAAFKAGQYKRLVQKKIDLTALHKKIDATHSDLGKLIDDLREEGRKSIMTQKEVKDVLARLDDLTEEAARLEAEIEQVKTESPEAPPPEENRT